VLPNPYGLPVEVFLGNIGGLWLLFAVAILKSADSHGKTGGWLSCGKKLTKQRKLL
jgi:hypothetical protein